MDQRTPCGNAVGAQSIHAPLQYQLSLFETEPALGEKIEPQRFDGIEQKPSPVSKAVKRITFLDLEEGMCRWPIGDPNDANFHFCGCPQTTGSAYCAHHAHLARQQSEEDSAQ